MVETGDRSVRVVVQAGGRLTREALAAYLANRPDFVVVGQAATTDDLHALCARSQPDAALVDAERLNPDSVNALRSLHANFPNTELVVIYADPPSAALSRVAAAGVSALVPSTDGLGAVLEALRRTNDPPAPVPAAVPPTLDTAALTDRELAVIGLMAGGHSAPEIARELGVRPHQVESDRRHIYSKLGVATQSQAVLRSLSLGLVDQQRPARQFGCADTELGRDLLVVVCGQPGGCRDEVVQAVVGGGLPFVLMRERPTSGTEHWVEWQRGGMTAVLVDPVTEDWAVPDSLGAASVVVRSTPPDRTAVIDAVRRGALALMACEEVADHLCPMIALAAHGHFTASAAYVNEITAWADAHSHNRIDGTIQLTAREREILGSVARGRTIGQTARALGVAAKTVENTQARLFRKLGARNRAEALTIAYRWGLVEPEVGAGQAPPS